MKNSKASSWNILYSVKVQCKDRNFVKRHEWWLHTRGVPTSTKHVSKHNFIGFKKKFAKYLYARTCILNRHCAYPSFRGPSFVPLYRPYKCSKYLRNCDITYLVKFLQIDLGLLTRPPLWFSHSMNWLCSTVCYPDNHVNLFHV